MRARHALFGAVVAALAIQPLAANAKTSCNMVSDPRDDAGFAQAPVPEAPSIDITSIDVASGKRNFAVALRLATSDPKTDMTATAGASWAVSFQVMGTSYNFVRRYGAEGSYTDTTSGGGAALSGVVVKAANNVITWTMPRNKVPGLAKRNAVVTGLFGQGATTSGAHDYAPDGGGSSSSSYKDKTPSCLRVS